MVIVVVVSNIAIRTESWMSSKLNCGEVEIMVPLFPQIQWRNFVQQGSDTIAWIGTEEPHSGINVSSLPLPLAFLTIRVQLFSLKCVVIVTSLQIGRIVTVCVLLFIVALVLFASGGLAR